MLKPLSQSNILIAGPARNISQYVAEDVLALLEACKNFKNATALVIESDSNDDTVSTLELLKCTDDRVNYTSLGLLVINNSQYTDIDFIAMADLDGINRQITADKIENCWKVKEPWDVITANQPNRYYDIWTLRHADWSPVDCLRQRDELEKFIGKQAANYLAVQAKQVSLDPTVGMIEVDSAFGGLGIYKKAAFIAGRYTGLDLAGNEVSDHISFHRDLRQAGYRIFINCALVNSDCHIDPPLPPPKSRTITGIKLLQKIGLALFGKDRFNKYLELLKKP